MGLLTDTAVRQAKATGKEYTLPDGDNLGLCVSPAGSKKWHFRFYWLGDQPRISLGTYPAISLKRARELRDEARSLVANGIDPRVHRQQTRAAAMSAAGNTFQAVFERWRDFKGLNLEEKRQSTLSQINRIFAKDVLPKLGEMSIFNVTRQHLLQVLHKVEVRGALSTAEKLRTWFNQLFRYAIVTLNLETNPAADLDIVAVPQPPTNHNPFLQMHQMPGFLCKLHNYRGHINTQLGVRLLLLTGVRTGELRAAVPEQFDVERAIWKIPPELVKQLQRRLKRKEREIPPYIVPLSRQALAIVKFLLDAMEPSQRLLLPQRGDLTESISENTLNQAITRMGYKDQLTGHGIRATIDTALHELGYDHNWIESQLSHANSDPYNHAKYVEQRRGMMQDWADRLDAWELLGLQGGGVTLTVPQIHVTPSAEQLPVVVPGDRQVANVSKDAGVKVEPKMPSPVITILARPDQRPQPMITDMQRERAEMLSIFESSHNLPLPVFAKLAGKSRDQINRDVKNRRLLSLTFGNRGHRIPEWQLIGVKQQLAKAVLERASNADSWHVYRALSEPLEGLSGYAPIDAVTVGNLNEIVDAVLEALQLHDSLQESQISVSITHRSDGSFPRAAD